jgi:hypothetical protein
MLIYIDVFDLCSIFSKDLLDSWQLAIDAPECAVYTEVEFLGITGMD